MDNHTPNNPIDGLQSFYTYIYEYSSTEYIFNITTLFTPTEYFNIQAFKLTHQYKTYTLQFNL